MSQYITLEEAANKLTWSDELVRFLVDAGAPSVDGLVDPEELTDWTLDHAQKVRELAGLEPVPPMRADLEAQDQADYRDAFFVLTITDFLMSHGADEESRDAWDNRRVDLLYEISLLTDLPDGGVGNEVEE